MIGSRFEVDASSAMCRLAFYGRLAALIDQSDPGQMRGVRIFKVKRRTGSIDRVDRDGLAAVCKGMFKKETDISVFAGLKVSTSRDSWRQAEPCFLVLQHQVELGCPHPAEMLPALADCCITHTGKMWVSL